MPVKEYFRTKRLGIAESVGEFLLPALGPLLNQYY